ncbi:hypothetical protein GGQ63_000724 [Prosthecomicrobium pneumaticum]|uniref:Uncharacterized protein n=1 Tax=Prosthecomicrobium pneumaticum TaxID=81895 RepID=A0A7W9CU61_9HYPH|nr:hypothetical protein [Prosthecomicrobium pneumaticum]
MTGGGGCSEEPAGGPQSGRAGPGAATSLPLVGQGRGGGEYAEAEGPPRQSIRHPGLRAGVHNRDAGPSDPCSRPPPPWPSPHKRGKPCQARTARCRTGFRLRRKHRVGRTAHGSPTVTIMDAGTEAGMTGGGGCSKEPAGGAPERPDGSGAAASLPPCGGVNTLKPQARPARAPVTPASVPGSILVTPGRPNPAPGRPHPGPPPQGETIPGPHRRHPSTHGHDYGCRHEGRHDGWRGLFEDLTRARGGAGMTDSAGMATVFPQRHFPLAARRQPG